MSLNRIQSFMAVSALMSVAAGFGLTTAHAEQIKLNAALAKPTMLAGEKALNYLKVKLTGFELPKASMRPPVNIALVLDRSGSMKGEKIQQAKRAALVAVDRLRDDDIVSVVTYDTNVRVLVPATRASDRDSIRQAIEGIQADGNTALFADFGVKNNYICADVELGCDLNKKQSAEVADNAKWNDNRKKMREYQDSTSRQQSYGEAGKKK